MDVGTALLPLGIIPALFILYVTLGGYEGKFKNAYIFLTFIGGIVLGTIIFLMELWWILGLNEEALHSVPNIIILSFFFLFLEQLSKLSVLNMRRFQKDEGVPLYGASLGLGFASPSGAVLLGFMSHFKIMDENIFSLGGVFLVVLAISLLLIGCTTGIWIGTAVKKKERIKGLFLASFAGMASWIAILLQVPLKPVSIYGYVLIAITFCYAILIYIYAYKRTLPFHLMDRKMKKKILEKKFF